MARLLNLILLILEIKALTIYVPIHKKRMFIYYTQLSNLMATFAAVLIIIFGPVGFVEVFRYTAECMLIMTFFVTTCILIPMGVSAKLMLFSGSGKYVHLLCPIISTISFFMFEDKPATIWILMPAGITLIYGLTMLYLNAKEKVDGPYPFFRVKHMKPRMTALWISALMLVTCLIAFGTFFLQRKIL